MPREARSAVLRAHRGTGGPVRIEIDAGSPQPPSEQIQDQVRFAVAAGRLAPGDRLPSVRGLAAQALVNPNTVAKAYRELEREGTTETRPGDGVFVAAGAPRLCASMRSRTIGERISRAIEEAVAAGLAPQEIEGIVARAVQSQTAKLSHDEAACGDARHATGASRPSGLRASPASRAAGVEQRLAEEVRT